MFTIVAAGLLTALAVFAVGVLLERAGYPIPDEVEPIAVSLEPDRNSSIAPESSPRPAASSLLRIAVAPVISPERTASQYARFAAYVGEKTGRRAILLQRESYAEVNDLVRFRICDLALVCTYPFVRGEAEFGMEALAVPVVDGESTYRSLVIVSPSSDAKNLLDLQGKSFASCDLMSNSGWLYPTVWLEAHGEKSDQFFGKHVITGSHDHSVLAVASGYVDAAAVHSLVYFRLLREDVSLRDRTRVIQASSPYGMPPFVVHPLLDPALKKELRTILLDMDEDPEGRNVLRKMHVDRFELPRSELYDEIREAAKSLESRS